MKKALITGINGMDGRYLSDLLLSKGYEVFGVSRTKSPNENEKVKLYNGDLTDVNFIYKAILDCMPDEIYHLAAISYHEEYWSDPANSYMVNAMSSVFILEAIKSINPKIKFLNITTSEIFGLQNGAMDENSYLQPITPYGIAKMMSQKNVEIYRNKFDIFACNAICFNHESPLRQHKFVTRKISSEVANIYLKSTDKIAFGNIYSRKDWGYAPDYVEGMYRIIQHEQPEDFILASQTLVSVEEMIQHAFKYVGIENWQDYIIIDQKMLKSRAATENYGIIDKAKLLLDWEPKTSIFKVIELMVDHDIKENKKDKNLTLLIS
jgi:GDPmannose 4,6-dehydratase